MLKFLHNTLAFFKSKLTNSLKNYQPSDYEKGLKSLSNIPKFHIGQEVKTPDGKGIIVNIEMPYNGLYIEPHRCRAVVWYSTMGAANGWVSKPYDLSELKKGA